MRTARLLASLFAGLILVTAIFGQEPTTQDDQAAADLERGAIEMLESAVSEAATLRLPENRALILATAGQSIWPRDAARGRQLFRDACEQLIALSGNLPLTGTPLTRTPPRDDLYSLRFSVLTAFARYDAELALEYLAVTRPPEVTAELNEYYVSRLPRPYAKAERELRLEQAIIAQSNADDPEKSAKIVRESIAKGLPQPALNLIFKIADRNADLANTLLAELFAKTIDSDFARSELPFAANLLKTFSQPLRDTPTLRSVSKLRVADRQMKELAVKVADRLVAGNASDLPAFAAAMPAVQRFAPEKIVAVRQKFAALRRIDPSRSIESPVEGNGATSAQILADAARVDPQFRGVLYKTAVVRAIASGDPERARSQLQEMPQSKERDDALATIDVSLAQSQVAQGKLDDARKLIDRMPAGIDKIRQIVALALASARTEAGRENALLLMEEARRLVHEYPDDREDTDAILVVAAGYAVIDPEKAFALLGPVIDLTNEVIGAGAVIARYYRQDQYFRDGELLISANLGAGGSRIARYGREIKLLARADLPRTKQLIDQFSRADVRVLAKIYVAQGILSERVGLDSGSGD